MRRLPRLLFRGVVALVFLFLSAPIVAVAIASFSASGGIVFPPAGFTLQWYRDLSHRYVEALEVSLLLGAGTTALATLVGTPAALALVRGRFRGKAALGAFCLSPLMVSTLVIAIAGFQFTVVVWDAFRVSLTGTLPALILAQSAFTIPFVIRAVVAGQAHFDPALEEAAANLGAAPWQVFRRVTLPLLLPAVVAGALFAFVLSFDDIAVPLFLGGGKTMTLPVKIYTAVEFNFDTDIMVVSTLITACSLAVMVLLDRLVGIDKVSGLSSA